MPTEHTPQVSNGYQVTERQTSMGNHYWMVTLIRDSPGDQYGGRYLSHFQQYSESKWQWSATWQFLEIAQTLIWLKNMWTGLSPARSLNDQDQMCYRTICNDREKDDWKTDEFVLKTTASGNNVGITPDNSKWIPSIVSNPSVFH